VPLLLLPAAVVPFASVAVAIVVAFDCDGDGLLDLMKLML